MNATSNRKLSSMISTLALASAATLGAAGCVVTGSIDADPYYFPDPVPVVAVAEVPIDTGASMAADPGDGVGVFVQYDAGGYWTIFTTCDTAISGTSCNFDILVSADRSVFLDNVQGFDLDPADSITLGTDGSINLVTDTSFGMDGLTFDADPGAVVEVDVLLDGVSQPQFVYVVSDGRLMSGVPTNPVDFAPFVP